MTDRPCINDFSEEPNWDGRGAAGTTPEAKARALRVSWIVNQLDPAMHAFPDVDGGVMFESEDNILLIKPDGSAQWADYIEELVTLLEYHLGPDPATGRKVTGR